MKDMPPYWTDPEKSLFEVSVESARKLDDIYHLRIREDVIRPAGGGQAGDKGYLKVSDHSVKIEDTVSDEEGVVLVTNGPLKEGTTGQLTIDMEWRLSMMKNHTAEHIFVSIIKKRFDNIVVGDLWIDAKHGSVELLGTKLDFDVIFETEEEVQRIIAENIAVSSKFVAASEIDPSVRSREGLTEKHNKLRVVSVGDFDSSACSGIHVLRTGDIGFFKVIDVKHTDMRTHVEFTSGRVAADIVSKIYNMTLQRKYSYPYEMEQLGAVLDRAKIAIDDKQKMIEKTTELLSTGPRAEQISGVIFKHEYLPGFDTNSLRILSNQMITTDPSIILLFAPGKKSQVILRVNEMPQDASEYISEPMKHYGGQGGGKGEVFTGGFVGVDEPRILYEKLVTEVRRLIG